MKHAQGGRVCLSRVKRQTQASIILGISLATLDDAGHGSRGAADERPAIAADLSAYVVGNPRSVVLLTGASGTGKSSILAMAKRQLRARGVLIQRCDASALASEGRRVVEMSPRTSTRAWLRFLADAGLAEARLLNRRARELSDGQRSRLALALMLASAARARRPSVLMVDEFLALLDRTTAMSCAASVARSIRRCNQAPESSLIVATSHDDLADALRPDLHITLDPRRPAQRHARAPDAGAPTTPEPGELA